MTAREVRNCIIKGLHEYLQVEVCKGNQRMKERKPPYIIYSVVSPYIADRTIGEFQVEKNKGKTVEIRKEQPSFSMSFVVCSTDRMNGKKKVYGDDEAMELAERAHGWFLHSGYDYISDVGVTVIDVTNVQNRETLLVDEEANRYGFDVTIRYVRQDIREIQPIEKIMIEGGKRSE
jgi:hypothetical protein